MGNVYTVNEILVGALSDRPAPDRNIILYVDSATGKASLANGTTWNDFGGTSIAGMTSDGMNGVLIAGAINQGDGKFVMDIPSNQTAVNTVFYVGLDPITGAAGATIELDGTTVLGSADLSNVTLVPDGRVQINRLTDGGPAVSIDVSPSVGATLFQAFDGEAGIVVLAIDGHGSIETKKGIGVFGHAAPTAPRTLAQSVITAITDANAKTAVQAVANALADIGALTLT